MFARFDKQAWKSLTRSHAAFAVMINLYSAAAAANDGTPFNIGPPKQDPSSPFRIGDPIRVSRGFIGCPTLGALGQVYSKIKDGDMKGMGQIFLREQCAKVPTGAKATIIQTTKNEICIGKPGAAICLWMANQFVEKE